MLSKMNVDSEMYASNEVGNRYKNDENEMKTLKIKSIRSMKVLLCVIWIVSHSAFVRSEWFHWWKDDFTPNPELEDEYIYEYGNDESLNLDLRYEESYDYYQKWDAVRNLYEGHIIGKLIKLCMAAHAQAGRGNNVSINAIKLNARRLSFENPYYESRPVDVLTYGVKNETDITTDYWDQVVGPQNYITEGVRPDCVCYLILLSSLKMEFSLHEQVCGLNISGITDVVPARKNKLTTLARLKRTRTTKNTNVTKKILRINRITANTTWASTAAWSSTTKVTRRTTVKKKITRRTTVKKKITRKTTATKKIAQTTTVKKKMTDSEDYSSGDAEYGF